MKMKILYLMPLLAILAAWQAAADTAIVNGQTMVEGVAAIVDDEPITFMDVERQSAETVNLLRQNLTGDALARRIMQTKLNVLKRLD